MDTWQAITLKELEALIAAQLADCSVEQKQLFEGCKVAPRLVPIERNGNVENVFVVAQIRDFVLYYEDVEDGFNISSLSGDGAIASPGYEEWELRHALRHLVAA